MHIKRKEERGITLIALVITIVILIILATISITLVFGEGGLIDRAQEGKQLTEQAQIDEQDELKGAEEYINGVLAGTDLPEEIPSIEEAKPNPDEDGPKYDNTTTIKDDLNNPVTIPGGFHLDKDSGTKVEEGIVIEDDNGNQFVWIPVGEYNVTTEVDKDGIQDGKLTNNLTRRTFTSGGAISVNGDEVVETNYYGEGDSRSIAKDQIESFKTSATTNKGFYIGRYEAGTEIERTASTETLSTPLVQANKYPYIYVTRDEAKEKAESMYNENAYVTSQLMSSYAWDTVLNFICQTNVGEGKEYNLSMTTDNTNGNIGTENMTRTAEYQLDGVIRDKNSNIYDFIGNTREWTTEYSISSDTNCVARGGGYNSNSLYAAYRSDGISTKPKGEGVSFRIQIYINPES